MARHCAERAVSQPIATGIVQVITGGAFTVSCNMNYWLDFFQETCPHLSLVSNLIDEQAIVTLLVVEGRVTRTQAL